MLRTTLVIRNQALALALAKIDQGPGAAGSIRFYTGTLPATPETGAAGALLATLQFSKPAFGTVADGLATAAAIAYGSCSTNGTVGWFRICDTGGDALFDGTVTVTSGSGDLKFNTIVWVTGGTVGITILQMEFPL